MDPLEEINAAIDATPTTIVQDPAFQVTRHEAPSARYLTALAQEALAKKALSHVVQVQVQVQGTMECFLAIYPSLVVRKENLESGIETLSRVINELAEKGYIHSCLSPLSSIELARMPKRHDRVVVFCFPLVPADKLEECKGIAGQFWAEEGCIGPDLDQADRELPEGQFFAEIHISHYLSMIGKGSKEDKLKEYIDKYLRVLPNGTEVVSTRECDITGLSVPFEVVFYNRLMKDYREVHLDYMRYAVALDGEDGKLEQFDLLTEISYTKR
jgi:hypothetical protein